MKPVFRTSDNGKTAGIISYFTIIGWLIAYFGFHQSNKTNLGSYQLRQTLLFHMVFMIVRYGLGFVIGTFWLATGAITGDFFLRVIEILFFVPWVIGFLGAINGEPKPIPLMGTPAQKVFSSI